MLRLVRLGPSPEWPTVPLELSKVLLDRMGALKAAWEGVLEAQEALPPVPRSIRLRLFVLNTLPFWMIYVIFVRADSEAVFGNVRRWSPTDVDRFRFFMPGAAI